MPRQTTGRKPHRAPKRRARGRSPARGRRGRRREWIGGRLSPPFFIHDREEPYRAELAIWMDAGSGLVVGQNVVAPEDVGGAVAQVLLDALDRPLAGPVGPPDAIRVADASLAAEVRAAIGDSIPIAVAPTPELDTFLETMIESMPTDDGERSYLEGGRIPPTAVSELFVAAKLLYGLAPWKVATEDRVLRLDIPQMGVEGACVSIIGELGEIRGLLIFPSLAGWTAVARAAEMPGPPGRRPDLGTGFLSLSYASAADLPASMRREAMSHAWPVFDAEASPQVELRDPDGALRPLTERDLKLATACAISLCTFFIKHGRSFEADEPEPVSESYFDDDDLEVRFTLPYEAFPLFEADPGAAHAKSEPFQERRPRVGRNDPCPCGSGRKYKKCHLPLDEGESVARAEGAAAHDLDDRLVRRLSEFAMARFGSKWQRFSKDFVDTSGTLEIAIPWSVYHYRVEGATILDWYRQEKGRRLSRAEAAWLEAQRASWLSAWEVTHVEPGARLTLRDMLTDETRNVSEACASQTLLVRDVILGRVVDHDGVSVLCGLHPWPLPPFAATEVVRRCRGRLRRKRAVPVERLREEAFGRYLIRRWEEAVADITARREVPPQLCNTDGESLLLTTDHYEIVPGAQPAVRAQLAALRGVEPPDVGEDPAVYVFLRPGKGVHASEGDTVVGHARLSDTALRLDTNSRERADALRERVEAACAEGIRHRAREHAEPLSPKVARDVADSAPPTGPTSAEAEQIVLDFKKRHYADWVDHPLPALGGKTPRQAVRSAQGRADVDLLLKDMENREQRSESGGAAFDFSELRRRLRLT